MRSRRQCIADFVTFPLRALTLFYDNRWGLSSLSYERYEYVSREVQGYCLDIGCGPDNRFVREHLSGRGVGIDVYPYEGLDESNLVEDPAQLPFPDACFDSVTFIANLNHIPETKRDAELREAYRVLRSGGNVIVTMGHPLAEVAVHKVVWLYDRLLGTRYDVDTERGMDEDERYFLRDSEIVSRLRTAGFSAVRKKRFATQWGLNHLLVGWKKDEAFGDQG